MEGKYVSKNDLQTKMYYEIWMQQKYAPTFSKLTTIYTNGYGVKKDLIKSKELQKLKKTNFILDFIV